MATFDLGRVTPLYKGDYSASTSYELNDVVLYNGNLYWHVQVTATVGILPTDTTVWKLAFADEGVRAEIRGYADNAQASADSALASKSSAATSASNASASASQAALSAQAAQSAETGATASAQTASTKASEATASAQSAASSAQTATDKATLSSQKAAAASESASLATAKAQAAATSETNARTAANTATTKATEAAASATSAQEYDESSHQNAINAQTSATNAAASEAQAQEYAEQAEESAEALSDINERLDDVKTDLDDVKTDFTTLSAQIRIIAARDDSWSAIRENVKMGFGELLYPVGTEFEVTCPSGAPYNSIIFVVVGHRVENSEHIMTMLMKHVIYSTEFDAIQAIICPEETMAAGTYHFTLLSGYDTDYDGGKNVQFTLANDLEAGGQIVMDWPHNQTWIGKNLTVYHAFGTSAVETCIMSEGTGGTDLGAADGTVSILNHTQRARYGSNNYKESAIREWLDSDDAANAWQTQQTRFQRPCSYRTRAGFVTYLDPEFVAVIREGSHPNRTNEIFDINGKKQAYSTTDKFYLASQEEIGFSSESGIACGTVFDYYNGAAQADKIKYDITAQTSARYWWLRAPYPSNAFTERFVNSSGALVTGYASSGTGAVAACEI